MLSAITVQCEPNQLSEFTNDQLPVRLIAPLYRALHWYPRGLVFYQLPKLISLTARAIIISYSPVS